MATNYKKAFGPHHGMQLMRGLDSLNGRSAPGPMIQPEFSLAPANTGAPATIGRFGRLFRASSYSPDNGAIHDLAQSMMEPESAPNDNPNLPLGFVFLGQFVDHDLTLDATTLFGQTYDPQAITDFRTPNLDLDNLYGAGPGVTRFQYDTGGNYGANPVKLLLDADRPFDLPRNSQNTAIIGDLRNDENFLVSQLHLALIKFHNAVVDWTLAQNPSNYSGLNGNKMLFSEASKTVRWHYQWILVHDFLPRIVGNQVVNEIIMNGLKLFNWMQVSAYPFMPVEFSTAAYRLGHTLLRQNYTVNSGLAMDLFDLPVFGNPKIDATYQLDFSLFFDMGTGAAVQKARKFDAKITMPVFNLPFIDPVQDPPPSLPERNMLRAKVFQVPSGQEVAEHFNSLGIPVQVYSNDDLGISNFTGLNGQAPLWFYILKESEFSPTNGLLLGPVGSRIVAEVIVGLLMTVSGNYLRDNPTWTPVLPSAEAGNFTMVDLINFAGANT